MLIPFQIDGHFAFGLRIIEFLGIRVQHLSLDDLSLGIGHLGWVLEFPVIRIWTGSFVILRRHDGMVQVSICIGRHR